jgi:hypothetical protein
MLNLKDDFIRNQESFDYAREITKAYGEIETILGWCKSELLDEWRWQLKDMSSPTRSGRYIFYFDSQRDYMAFVLKWDF